MRPSTRHPRQPFSPSLHLRLRRIIGALLVLFCLIFRNAALAASPSQLEFFEQRIRPILVSECYECHGPNKQKGGLRLDFRQALLKGGNTGPAVIPGDANNSLLIQSIRHEHPEAQMPKDRPQLAATIIADFVTWIREGALDPRDQPASKNEAHSATWESTRKSRQDWWSFKPLQIVPAPNITNSAGSQHPVDRFLLAKMQTRGLQLAPKASRESLLRRATFALTGLPPTPAEIESFLRDPDPNAYEKQIDRLLASPRFGERWARHWMDLVRYCESHGSQGDPELPMAWRYRDYLVRAFNQDLAYNQFVKEHIAGDLLPHPRINLADGLNESMLGPAHLRMVELGYVPVDALDDQVKVVDNQIDVFSKTFLGLTVSCARCHDHKFDPISQKDFYALYGIFASCRPGQVVVDAPELLQTNRAELADLKRQIRASLADSWASAAPNVIRSLQQETEREREKKRLETEINRVLQALAEVETRARAQLTAQSTPGHVTPLPTPMARWTFEGDLRESIGSLHGKAEGDASVRGGRLILNGTNAWVTTEPLPLTLTEKTLEVWVALSDLDQRGGGVMTVQTPDSERFDSIVFGEREPRHWIAGSDYFRRTRDVGGPAETAKPGELIHLAAVYGADHSITLYRNGALYGAAYQQGNLQTFEARQARILFGKRHLAPGVTSLAGEIEEARLYSRALKPDEISASFRAGARTVDAASLAKALTPAEREKWDALQQELKRLQTALAHRIDPSATAAAWKTALTDAAENPSNPLHPWVKLSALSDAALEEGWNSLAAHWTQELASRREFNRTNFTHGWNLQGAEAESWFLSGKGPAAANPAGEFSVEIDGDRVLRGLYPKGVFTHALTRKANGVFTSPRFQVPSDNISIRGLGDRSRVRLVVENYPIGGGGIYPALSLATDEMKWFRLDTAYRKGAHAYLEFITADDSPISDAAPGGRSYFGAAEVVFHQIAQPPKELIVPTPFLLLNTPPRSANDLAQLYLRTLTTAISLWREGRISDEAVSFLDFFVRRDLLPTTLTNLPNLAPSVAAYRKLENAIPVPRRAPGVFETQAFHQPLFVRGSITQPSDPVPRRFLEMFNDQPFPTQFSGRLELAAEVTNMGNPLTARVMVNRLWHHLFGRGLVGTVDNFGRLGEKPTHPELLDYLAASFIENRWSIKQSIRFLMTSHAFQQSSEPSEAALRIDPNNELLSHARVRRLDAEAIRDSVLAVSGQLDLKMAGPGVNVYYVSKTEGGGAKGPLDGDRRRSVYQRIRRNAANPFLEAFDAPKPTSTRGKRDATNVPAQSLALLNDPFILDQSGKWATSLVADALNRDERVRRMIVRALGRSATSEDLDAARDFLEALAADHKIPPADLEKNQRLWQDFAQSLFCLKEFIYLD